MAKQVAKIYGDALFSLAVEQNAQDTLYEELFAVQEALRANPGLTQLMAHPGIDTEGKLALAEDIFKGRASDMLTGMICMLVQKGHFRQLDEVLSYVIDRIREYKNIGRAHVTSAMEMSQQEKDAVEQRLLATTKYVSFETDYEVDPSLIGGMVIRIRDRVMDSSIRTKLNGLTKDLMKIQLKVGECAP